MTQKPQVNCKFKIARIQVQYSEKVKVDIFTGKHMEDVDLVTAKENIVSCTARDKIMDDGSDSNKQRKEKKSEICFSFFYLS